MIEWLKRFFSRSQDCSGAGQQASNGMIREVDPSAEEAIYMGQCPECGKQRPCDGYSIMLAHGK